MSATLASLNVGLLCFSVLTYFSKARIFHVAIKNGQLQYGHTYQLNDRTNKNDGRIHEHTPQWCGNGCTSEQSSNRIEH